MKSKIKKIVHKPYSYIKQLKNHKRFKKFGTEILDELESANKNERKIWYFCAAVHNNLGDMGQRYCIEKWIKEKYSEYKLLFLPTMGVRFLNKKLVKIMKEKLNDKDIFIFQSGYTMSDNHPDDIVRRLILKTFINNQCIIFPQTILYGSNKKIKEMEEILKNVKKLKLLARDEISKKNAEKYFPNICVKLYPDIVTTLIGKYKYENERNGILFVLRDDGEKLYSDTELNKLMDSLKKYTDVMDRTDTNTNYDINYLIKNLKTVLENKFEEFSKYKLIITDRYHGTIFSLISNTPVIVLNSTDHKLSSGVNWFKNVYDDYVYYCNDIKNVPALAEEILSKKLDYNIKPYFNEKYYDKLKQEILD